MPPKVLTSAPKKVLKTPVKPPTPTPDEDEPAPVVASVASSDVKNNQIIYLWDEDTDSPIEFDPETQLVFLPPVKADVQLDEKQKMTYYRLPIHARNADGTFGDFLLMLDKVFTFGVKRSNKPQTETLNGYDFGVSLYQKDPDARQQHMEKVLQSIEDAIQAHLLSIKNSVGKSKTWQNLSNVSEARVLRWKTNKDTEERIGGVGPVVNCKMMCAGAKNNFRIYSKMYKMDMVTLDGNYIELDPYEQQGKRGYAKPLIRLESIFIGSKVVSVKVQLYDTEFSPSDGGIRTLRVPGRGSVVVDANASNPLMSAGSNGRRTVVTTEDEFEE
jgi:hypothetical protein